MKRRKNQKRIIVCYIDQTGRLALSTDGDIEQRISNGCTKMKTEEKKKIKWLRAVFCNLFKTEIFPCNGAE